MFWKPARQKHNTNLTTWMIARVCCIATALSFIQCADIAGTGSQAGNGRISCMIHNRDGSPASGATVHLRQHDYIVSTAFKKDSAIYRDEFTDSHGKFSIDSIDTGSYSIEVNDGKSNAVMLNCTVTRKGFDVNIPSDTLQPTGIIKGIVNRIPGDTVTLFIRVYGLERVGILDTATGSFTINDVPCGNYDLCIFASSMKYLPMKLTNVKIKSNTTTDVGNIDFANQSKWQYSRKLFLNTSSTGAGVAGMVTNFPVLVRLRSNNFNFSQAKTDGSDIRFSKANGASFPYQIERWDAVKKEADVWVKVDTVFGNDSTHYLVMYWGNSFAADNSNGSAVFNTAAGYQGVWHLDDNGTTIVDATANKHDGLRKGNQVRTAENISFAQSFDGSGDFTEIGNVCNPDTSSFTVCAWIKKIGANKIQAIVSKSIGGTPSSSYGLLFELDANGAVAIFIATSTGVWGDSGTFVLTSNKWITDSTWHHVAAVIDRSNRDNCRVYIDGSDVSALPAGGDIKNVGKIVNSSPLRFGSDANAGCQWTGLLDEISILYRAQSADFIKLSFMNQKSSDALIVFK